MLVVAVCSASAVLIVSLLLGSQWTAVAHLIPVMGAAALLNTLSQLPAVGLDADGHIKRRLVAQSGQLIALVSALSVCVLTNAPPVAYAYSWLIGETCRHAMLLQACRRLFELRTLKLLTGYLSAILLSVPPALVASLSKEASSQPAGLLIVLAGQTREAV
jgi:hypothetical protein